MNTKWKYRLTGFATLIVSAVVVATVTAQAPEGSQAAATIPPPSSRSYPAPQNLKVLPKDMTGQQVHDIMKQWAGALGVQCGSCHADDPDNIGPDGHPQLKFADDSKPMKGIARTMYTMTDEINSNYIAKVEGSGVPVTCGTCHRGHLGPEPFTVEPKDALPSPLECAQTTEKSLASQ